MNLRLFANFKSGNYFSGNKKLTSNSRKDTFDTKSSEDPISGQLTKNWPKTMKMPGFGLTKMSLFYKLEDSKFFTLII